MGYDDPSAGTSGRAAIFDLDDPVQVAARTAWAEGHGEAPDVLGPILNTIDTRRRLPGWWGHTIITVCLRAGAYRCWLPMSPIYHRMLEVDVCDHRFATALRLAEAMVGGNLPDHVNRADSYHRDDEYPEWARGIRTAAQFGSFSFYVTIGQRRPVLVAG